MGMFYQEADGAVFDYALHELEGVPRQLFRGPAVDVSRPYIACIGAAQTFGRFCHRPYPQLLGERLGIQVLNLGIGGAGPRAFLAPHLLEWLNGAVAVVVQVLSGRSESNSFFDNSRKGTQRGVRVSDGVSMRYEQFLGEMIATEPVDRVVRAVAETRDNYVANMCRLLDGIRCPRILLWLSKRTPRYTAGFGSVQAALGAFPQLVDEGMVDRLRTHADHFVECVSSDGLPQRLWAATAPVDGTTLQDGVLFNHYYPSPEMHAKAAALLEGACREAGVAGLSHPVKPAAVPPVRKAQRFVVVCAERTGSNLLIGLLGSHPACQAAGELFNPRQVESGRVAGFPPPDQTRLHALRCASVPDFIAHVFADGERSGYMATGFKFMYGHAKSSPVALDYLRNDTGICIIHLKRRNLLRRFISHRQASQSEVWRRAVDPTLPESRRADYPALRVPFHEVVADMLKHEKRQAEFDEHFQRHRVLEVFYEDLAIAPQEEGARVAAFLGLDVEAPLRVETVKTGHDSLPGSVENYEELRAEMRRWLSFFDD